MNWMDIEIERWQRAEYEAITLTPIPADLQVGRVLHMFSKDIRRCRNYIEFNMQEDNRSYLFAKEGYWADVLRKFDARLERDINRLITE